jgi:hypothetical protein
MSENETVHIEQRRDWEPAPAALAKARERLATFPDAECVVIPLVQLGKTKGWWDDGGYDVVTLGVQFLAGNGPSQFGYRVACNDATTRAVTLLNGHYKHRGTAAYAVVYRDGPVSVFER